MIETLCGDRQFNRRDVTQYFIYVIVLLINLTRLMSANDNEMKLILRLFPAIICFR